MNEPTAQNKVERFTIHTLSHVTIRVMWSVGDQEFQFDMDPDGAESLGKILLDAVSGSRRLLRRTPLSSRLARSCKRIASIALARFTGR